MAEGTKTKEIKSLEEMCEILQAPEIDLRMSISGQFVWKVIPQKLHCVFDRVVKTDEYERVFSPLRKYYDEEMLVEANLKAQTADPDFGETMLYWCRLVEPSSNLPFTVKICEPKDATHIMLLGDECCRKFCDDLLIVREYFIDIQAGWLVIPVGYQAVVYDKRVDGIKDRGEAQQICLKQIAVRGKKYREKAQAQYEQEFESWLNEATEYRKQVDMNVEYRERLERARDLLHGIDVDILLAAMGKRWIWIDHLNNPQEWILRYPKDGDGFIWQDVMYSYSEKHVEMVEEKARMLVKCAEFLLSRVRSYEAKFGNNVDYYDRLMREIAKRCRTYFKVDYLRYKAWREPKVKLDGVHVEFYEQYVKIWDDQTTMMNQIICYES